MSEDRRLPDGPEIRELRARFLSSLGMLRPKLHRFCARMCGSVLDGEDLVQETLAAASYKVTPQNAGFLEPSLFRMAYQRCATFIRLDLGHREQTIRYGEGLYRTIGPQQPWTATPIEEALVSRVSELPSYERAVLLLLDVLGFSYWDTIEVVGATVGRMKVALHRARATLRELPPRAASAPLQDERLVMLRAYAERFNRLDAHGLRRLIRRDARVEIVGAFNGKMTELDAVYTGAYAAQPWEWRLSAALVDGDPALITSRRLDASWHPYSAVRLWWEGANVVRIRDYMHIRHVLRDARIEPAADSSQS